MGLWHLFFYFHHQKGSEQNLFFSKFDFMLWNQLNILEAHPGVWEMEEQGKFYVWGTGVGISNFIQVNKETAHPPNQPLGGSVGR